MNSSVLCNRRNIGNKKYSAANGLFVISGTLLVLLALAFPMAQQADAGRSEKAYQVRGYSPYIFRLPGGGYETVNPADIVYEVKDEGTYVQVETENGIIGKILKCDLAPAPKSRYMHRYRH